MSAPTSGSRIALAAAPWSIFNRPSLQLGSLKSYVEGKLGLAVDCFHPYLAVAAAIGVERYHRIARSGWAGEALFAPLLFPEMRDQAEKLFTESMAGELQQMPAFPELVAGIEKTCDAWISSLEPADYLLFGFSVSFFQLLSSLYLARQLKEKRPGLPIVFGGSSCAGEAGASLFRQFHHIDFLVDGEGEAALCRLCRFLMGEADTLPAGVLSRHSLATDALPAAGIDMNELPAPDYAPYFREMRRHFPGQPFIPTLPVEFSRGCWWNRCTFCNLNLQWHDYRCKRAETMAAEILHLAETHESLQFTFADNALPIREADRFFARIGETGLDLRFFAEIRTVVEPDRLHLYRRGGLETIQVGIEALSNSLLKKMNKGCTVMDIMAVMKLSSEAGICTEGNIITQFPGTTEAEIAETLANLDFLLPFSPLQEARFFLGYGSPVHARPRDFSMRAVIPHARNRRLFPEAILRHLTLLVCGYRGDGSAQRRRWRPVSEKMRAWREYHSKRDAKQPHPLSFMDGGTFLIIRQERPAGAPLLHRLRGGSRGIYLFCGRPRRKTDILREFPAVSAPALEKFLEEMSGKRLMFVASDQALSLAIRSPRG